MPWSCRRHGPSDVPQGPADAHHPAAAPGHCRAVGLWQLEAARRTAADVFDKRLLSATPAVSNNVTLSGGDALSPRPQRILANASGGLVFFHAYAPDSEIVAAYATLPFGIPRASATASRPRYFQATYLGLGVSAVRLEDRTEIDGFSGVFSMTVWQDNTVRTAFAGQLAGRWFAASAALIVSLALVVWFEVSIGTHPPLGLQDTTTGKTLRPDPAMIREALLSLVDNAVRQGGPAFTSIVIRLAPTEGAVEIAVSDDGGGIPQESIAVAPGRFSQVRQTEGSGLGLPIVAAIVAAHSGTFEVRSQERGVSVA